MGDNMKILIIRTYPSIMNIKNYNSQEIGLARAYIRAGHDCDIVYYAGNTKSYTEKIPADNGKEITIHWLRSFSVFNNGFFFGLGKLIKQYGASLELVEGSMANCIEKAKKLAKKIPNSYIP